MRMTPDKEKRDATYCQPQRNDYSKGWKPVERRNFGILHR